nr:MAG TPA: hypothetical protein [Caudoviricetes sp.]
MSCRAATEWIPVCCYSRPSARGAPTGGARMCPTGVFISMLLYALPVVARELPTHNREKIFLKRGLTYLIEYAIT